jgi:hypothetical protein
VILLHDPLTQKTGVLVSPFVREKLIEHWKDLLSRDALKATAEKDGMCKLLEQLDERDIIVPLDVMAFAETKSNSIEVVRIILQRFITSSVGWKRAAYHLIFNTYRQFNTIAVKKDRNLKSLGRDDVLKMLNGSFEKDSQFFTITGELKRGIDDQGNAVLIVGSPSSSVKVHLGGFVQPYNLQYLDRLVEANRRNGNKRCKVGVFTVFHHRESGKCLLRNVALPPPRPTRRVEQMIAYNYHPIISKNPYALLSGDSSEDDDSDSCSDLDMSG